LRVVDRAAEDPRAIACSAQLRYEWEGTPQAGDTLVFTQLYAPHPPFRPSAASNNPGAKATYSDPLQASAGADGIRVHRDDTAASVLTVDNGNGHVDWVVFNPHGLAVDIGARTTNARFDRVRAPKTN